MGWDGVNWNSSGTGYGERAVVNAAMKLRFTQNAGEFLD
jgi:hypothetical protein